MNQELEWFHGGMPLLDYWLQSLASLPIWMGLALLIGAGMVLTLLGSLLVGVSGGVGSPPGFNFLSGAKFGFLGEVFAVLLAFVLVDGGLRYSDAREAILQEAGALRLFDAVVADLAAPGTDELRRQVRTYATAVVESEGISMQSGRESLAARAAYERVLDTYLRLPIPSEQERLMRLQADQFLVRIQDSRQKRLQAARPGLRNLIWTIFLINTLIAILFSWVFRARTLAAHMAMATVMTVAVMAIVHLVVLLYHPFIGDLAISLTPYRSLPPL